MKQLLLCITVLGLVFFWSRLGFDNVDIDTDLGRDLSELSNIWLGKVVWLGPRLSPGLHASSSYYYFFFPFLKLGGGDVRSLFVGALSLSAIVLWWFGREVIKKFGIKAIVGVLLIGLSYWWMSFSFHPGNGFTFALFVFATLISMYFEYPLFLSALLLGFGLAFHPTAIFTLPLLIYEWWRRGKLIKNLALVIIGLLLPSAPLILFEIITKGYVIRHFLSNPNSVMHFQFHLENFVTIAEFLRLPILFLVFIWALVGLKAKERLRSWYWLITIQFVFFMFVSKLAGIYMFSIAAMCEFVMVMVLLIQKRIGTFLLVTSLGLVGLNLLQSRVQPVPSRPLYKIEAATKAAIDSEKINRSTPLAVVAALSQKTEVPQADDYRFLLRIKGYNVLEVSQYSEAKQLIMFIEQPNFDWQSWGNWETDQFGRRKEVFQTVAKDIRVIVFDQADKDDRSYYNPDSSQVN